MLEPPKETGSVTRGYLFAEAVNTLLDVEGGNMLRMNTNIYGPIFEETIEELNRDKKDMHADTVWATTALRLYDDLKAKIENFPSDYFVQESIRLRHLNEIAEYLQSHPQTRDQFYKIEVLQELPKQE